MLKTADLKVRSYARIVLGELSGLGGKNVRDGIAV
jgi:hypothetical protein